MRVFHDGEWWIQGVMGDSAGWVQKGGPGLQRGKQHGMQVTMTLHCPFPTLSPFSKPSPFQFRHVSWDRILPWLAAMATSQNISLRNQPRLLGMNFSNLHISTGRENPNKSWFPWPPASTQWSLLKAKLLLSSLAFQEWYFRGKPSSCAYRISQRSLKGDNQVWQSCHNC